MPCDSQDSDLAKAEEALQQGACAGPQNGGDPLVVFFRFGRGSERGKRGGKVATPKIEGKSGGFCIFFHKKKHGPRREPDGKKKKSYIRVSQRNFIGIKGNQKVRFAMFGEPYFCL